MHEPGRAGFARNLLQIVGHVGGDPRPAHTKLGLISRFNVAVNRGQHEEWFQVAAHRELATQCQRHIRKGLLVYIEGALRHRRYEDRDGVRHLVSAVMASDVQVHRESGGNLNRWLVAGRLGADPELHYSGEGAGFIELSIGADIPRPEQEFVSKTIDWVPVALWGVDAERAALLAARGRTVVAEGYARREQWVSDDGQRRSRWRLIPTERVQFIGKREHWEQRAAEQDSEDAKAA